MSSFIARVSEIKNSETLHIVKFDFHGIELSMMSLDLHENVKVGVRVKLVVNPTHIVIAKDFTSEISCLNRLEATVAALENGELLSSVKLNVYEERVESIITRDASNAMSLSVGNSVVLFLQESELSIGEVLDD